MSSSLVRKSLELVESESKETNLLKSKNHNVSKNPMKSKKRGIVDHRLRTLGDVRSEAALLVKKVKKQAVIKKDNTTTNLELLTSFSNFKGIKNNVASKIWDQTVKSRKLVDDTAPESQSVFTEEDFRQFEESYFVK